MTRAGKKLILASHVGLEHFFIVEGEREGVEDLGGAELWVPLQDPLDTRAAAIERPQPAHRNAGTEHIGAAAEHVRIGSHMRMRH